MQLLFVTRLTRYIAKIGVMMVIVAVVGLFVLWHHCMKADGVASVKPRAFLPRKQVGTGVVKHIWK
jgi:hypothetical protein